MRSLLLVTVALVVVVGRAAAAEELVPADSYRGAHSDDPQALEALIRFLESRRAGNEVLAAMLADERPEMQERAALALGRNRAGGDARDSLIALLQKSTSPSVRKAAAFALGEIGTPELEPTLVKTMKRERDPAVQASLLDAIGRLAGGKAVKYILETMAAADPAGTDVRVHGLLALGTMGRRNGGTLPTSALTVVRGMLGAWDPEERLAAAWVFSQVPDEEATDSLVRLLRSDSSLVQEMAARALSHVRWKHPRDVSDLLLSPDGGAGGPHWTARVHLAEGLARHPGLEAEQLLLELIRTEGRRYMAQPTVTPKIQVLMAALDALYVRVVLEPSSRVELDGIYDDWTRRIAARGTFDTGIALRVGHVHCALAEVLDRIHGNRLATCGPTDYPRRFRERRWVRVLASREAVSLPALLAIVRSDSPSEVRAAAVEALSSLPLVPPEREAALRHLLEDPDPAVVGTAAAALGSMEHLSGATAKVLRDTARRLVADHEAEPLMDVVKAMAIAGDSAAVPLLERMQGSPVTAFADEVRRALRELGESPEDVRIETPKVSDELLAPYRDTNLPRRVTIWTSAGNVELELLPELAPITVRQFLQLAGAGFYDGLVFHRVVPAFVVQGGDPLGTGHGGPSFLLRDENNPLPFRRGVVGMAHAGKDTAGSQLFFTTTYQPHLLGTYTAWARVRTGMDAVDSIVQGDIIRRITMAP